MTADIELLPLPERFDCTNGNTPWCQGCYTMTPNEYGDYVQWEDCERITAAQAAKIERLRAVRDSFQRVGIAAQDRADRLEAEVEAVWAAMPRDARYLDPPDGGCAPLHEQVRRMAADATRAERLADAMRAVVADMREWGEPAKGAHVERIQRRLDDALRDHDQEGE